MPARGKLVLSLRLIWAADGAIDAEPGVNEMAVVAVGDIHGNLLALDDLLDKVTSEIASGDTVVFLGDYIDRGPDSKGCIERILDLERTTKAQVVGILGNHEQWMLETCRDFTRHSWLLGMEALATIQSYAPQAVTEIRARLEDLGPRIILEKVRLPYELFFDAIPAEHMAFLSGLRTFFRAPEGVFVHGGVNPAAGKVEAQKTEHLIWGVEGFPDHYHGADAVVYGHANNAVLDENGWPHPRIAGRTYGLDTIAYGVLTALRLPDGAIMQSRRQLCT
jgi:serine/threonine protein phosphatase 1